MEAGQHNFEAFMQYMTERGIIREPFAVDELFADVGQTPDMRTVLVAQP
jgi:hypothetical protein